VARLRTVVGQLITSLLNYAFIRNISVVAHPDLAFTYLLAMSPRS
jgi:hypothetical protein